jgi:hypothetical protein
MSSAAAFDVIETILRTGWVDTPIYFENEDYPIDLNPNAFLRVEIFGDSFKQESIGAAPRKDNLWREMGVVYVHVMTERGSGSRQARVYADMACELFRGADVSDVEFQDMSIGSGDQGVEDGKYYRMTAMIEWKRD